MASEAVKRRVAQAKRQFEEHSKSLEAGQREWSARRTMFPSTMPGDRGATSPLGGTAEFPWGPKKKGG
jgi:hypothetical protein